MQKQETVKANCKNESISENDMYIVTCFYVDPSNLDHKLLKQTKIHNLIKAKLETLVNRVL